jgi:transposase-like protein
MIEPSDANAGPSREESELTSLFQREEGQGKAAGNGNSAKDTGPPHKTAIPDPEVAAFAKRRRFSADYKARVVEEAESCTEPGAIGALLRREGLYSSQLSSWRALYRTGALQALRDDKRGRKTKKHPLQDENEKLRKQNERLTDRLERAETIIEIQKKVATMLGIPLNSVDDKETK